MPSLFLSGGFWYFKTACLEKRSLGLLLWGYLASFVVKFRLKRSCFEKPGAASTLMFMCLRTRRNVAVAAAVGKEHHINDRPSASLNANLSPATVSQLQLLNDRHRTISSQRKPKNIIHFERMIYLKMLIQIDHRRALAYIR